MATVYTSAGEAYTADIFDETTTPATDYYIAWGTGAGTAAKSDTTLFTEAAEARKVGTATQPAADTNQWTGTMTSTSTQTITNAGLFTALTGATLVVKGDFAGVALNSGDKIKFTVQLQWS